MKNWYDFLKFEELVSYFHKREESEPNPRTCEESEPNPHTCEESEPNHHTCENWHQILTPVKKLY